MDEIVVFYNLLAPFIRDIGFPIFVSVYLLTSVRKALNDIKTTNEEIIRILRRTAGA